MSAVTYNVPELTESVTRPVNLQIARYIRDVLSLGNEVRMVMGDEILSQPQVGSTVTDINDNSPLLGTEDRIEILVTEKPVPEENLSTNVDYSYERSVIYDKDLQWFIRPIRTKTDVTMEFNYQSNSRTKVTEFANSLRVKIAQYSPNFTTDVRYEYPVPMQLLYIVNKIYTNREAVAGYGEDWLTYLENCIKVPHDYKTTLGGKDTTLVLREELEHIVLNLSDIEIPERERKDNGVWSIKLNLTYRYDKPISFYMNYPIFVHNNWIDPRYFDTTVDRNKALEAPAAYSNYYQHIADSWDYARALRMTSDKGYIYPPFDDWEPLYKVGNYVPLLTIQIAVDEANPRTVLDFAGLPSTNFAFHPQLATYLKRYREKIMDERLLPLAFRVYDSEMMLNSFDFEMTEDLVIVSKKDLNPRHRYHVMMMLNRNLDVIPDEVIDDIIDNTGDLIVDIIDTIDPEVLLPPDHKPVEPIGPIKPVEKYPPYPRPKPDPDTGTVDKDVIDDIIDDMDTTVHLKGKMRPMWTVNNIIVCSSFLEKE